jgi:hypothetical protein
VFAFYYSFFESKYFSIIDHNITDEIAGILLLIGLALLCFSREKIEDERTQRIRSQSMILSFYINIVFILSSMFFIYGIAFLHVLIINLFSQLFFYYLVFSIGLHKWKSTIRTESTNR